MSNDQKKQLEQQLWNIANDLRNKMNADEYRNYILGFIFFKYLSERQYLYANDLIKGEKINDYRKLTDQDFIAAMRAESLERLGYFLPPNDLFEVLIERGSKIGVDGKREFILNDLERILTEIEQSTMGTASEDDFVNLFEDLDLNSNKLGKSPDERNETIVKILIHLNNIDFQLENAESDVLGDAYEYLIGQFASGAGKKAGEFYTPQQISKVLAKLVTVGKERVRTVYDPTCGSGSLLLRVGKEAKVGTYYGQELNRTTYNLARMNMILRDVEFQRFDIRQDDTLTTPRHLDKEFEAIVANPPFSAKWEGSKNAVLADDERFTRYGRLAPNDKADFAFVQHMIYHLAENGTLACILPHGVLFRVGAEETIRKYIIKNLNYLDAVIGLPANLFYGTSIPTCILVLKKCRTSPENVLFIDSSEHFEKSGNQNTLTDEHIDEIITTYKERKTIDKYSYVASLEEIKENEYNLNIPRYVDTFEPEPRVDLEEVSSQLQLIEGDLHQTNETIAEFCKELGIKPPF